MSMEQIRQQFVNIYLFKLLARDNIYELVYMMASDGGHVFGPTRCEVDLLTYKVASRCGRYSELTSLTAAVPATSNIRSYLQSRDWVYSITMLWVIM